MTCAVQERTEESEMDLHTLFESLELPDGYRAEIINGSIIVSPTPTYKHTRIVKRVERALDPAVGEELEYFQMGTVEIAKTGERFVPDLMVMPLAVAEGEGWDGSDWIRPAEELELAVEVVSVSSARRDRVEKTKGYAQAGLPLYLLVDPREREIVLFSKPERDGYQKIEHATFGSSIKLPSPFDVELEVDTLLK